jgi:predicted MFS family arabinose efflux permease
MSLRGTAGLVLATCFAVLLMNSGARFAMGLLLKPMAEDLAWSRTALSSAVTVFMIIAAASLPFMGRLVDTFGARRVLGTCVALSALGILALPFVQAPWQLLVCYGVIFALGSAGTSITPIGVLLSEWFPGRLGMANSIAISGMGLGQLLVISVLAALLTDIGWRGAYLGIAIAMFAIVIPVLFLPTNKKGGSSAAPAAVPAADNASATVREALRRPRVQWLLAIYLVCGFQDFFIATHIVAYALDTGVESALAGHMLAFMGLVGLAGVLATGWFNDRVGPLGPTAVCFVLRIGLFAALLSSDSHIVVIVSALVYGGTFWITAPLTVVFTRQLVGTQLLGTMSGIITMTHHAAGGVGAIVGALMFDSQGNYTNALWLSLVLSVLALAMCLPLRASRTDSATCVGN